MKTDKGHRNILSCVWLNYSFDGILPTSEHGGHFGFFGGQKCRDHYLPRLFKLAATKWKKINKLACISIKIGSMKLLMNKMGKRRVGDQVKEHGNMDCLHIIMQHICLPDMAAYIPTPTL